MISTNDVREALWAVLGENLKGLSLLDNPKRQDFSRPACFLQHIRREMRPGNVGTVTMADDWLATLFPELDEYRDCSAEARSALQDGALDAFRCGTVPCGDRALRVSASSGGESADRAWVDIQVVWMEPRAARTPDAPAARTVDYETFGAGG